MKVAIIGGGAAGMFLAINLKEINRKIDVTVFEKSNRLLSKLEVSGGGRCNCTNTFQSVKDLSKVYPRGARTISKLFNTFSYSDAYVWFETHGVRLKVEDNGRVFPITDDSHTIINMFVNLAKKYNIKIKTLHAINSLSELSDFDCIAITTGGMLHNKNNVSVVGNDLLNKPLPSLFSFRCDDKNLTSLSGTSIKDVTAAITKTKFKVTDDVLLTHKGFSGPCILKLSSFGAKVLNERDYKFSLLMNWVSGKDEEVLCNIKQSVKDNGNKLITNQNPFFLPQRFWEYILRKTMPNRMDIKWKDITQKEINRIINALCNDEIAISGRITGKDEFVTCGGISLNGVDLNTMSLKNDKRLFFAGEVLDIDGVTGGYNFQAAWTTAFVAAKGIASSMED